MDLFKLLPYGKRASLEDYGIYILPQAVPPRNATLLDQTRSLVVPQSATLTMFEYRTPPNRRGILRRLAVDAVDPAGLPSLLFSVLRSGAPVPNYQINELPIGTIGVPDEVNVVFDGDQVLQVVVQNVNAFTPYEAYVRVVGHWWDVIEERGR
jgi:hypothetical protein